MSGCVAWLPAEFGRREEGKGARRTCAAVLVNVNHTVIIKHRFTDEERLNVSARACSNAEARFVGEAEGIPYDFSWLSPPDITTILLLTDNTKICVVQRVTDGLLYRTFETPYYPMV